MKLSDVYEILHACPGVHVTVPVLCFPYCCIKMLTQAGKIRSMQYKNTPATLNSVSEHNAVSYLSKARGNLQFWYGISTTKVQSCPSSMLIHSWLYLLWYRQYLSITIVGYRKKRKTSEWYSFKTESLLKIIMYTDTVSVLKWSRYLHTVG